MAVVPGASVPSVLRRLPKTIDPDPRLEPIAPRARCREPYIAGRLGTLGTFLKEGRFQQRCWVGKVIPTDGCLTGPAVIPTDGCSSDPDRRLFNTL